MKNKLPCLDTANCGSSDAMHDYGSHYFCFACRTRFNKEKKVSSEEEKSAEFEAVETPKLHMGVYETLKPRGFKDRGIERHVCEFYDVRVEYNTDREIKSHWYPYGVTKTTGAKVRILPKEFASAGKITGLFGQPLFNGGKRLVITEGEIDALTVAQCWYEKYKVIYPVVSVPNAQTAAKVVVQQRDWILSFDEIVIWMDDDEPGIAASNAVARALFKEGKTIKVVTPVSGSKDASDVYRNNSTQDSSGCWIAGPGHVAVLNCVYNARVWSPAGVVLSSQTWETYTAEADAVYIPYTGVLANINRRNYGRRLGSITMITAGTGMGKSLLLKEDMYHLQRTRPPEEKIGVLALEESIYEFISGIMSIEANKRLSLPENKLTREEERVLWERTMGDDRYIMLDHQGAVSDDSLIDKIVYMALNGAVYIYLDHVTIAVSESGDNQNAAIDKLMSDLLKIAKRWKVWICVVSHLRKTINGMKSFENGAIPTEDDLKGSGSLKQIPMQTFALSRDKYSEDEVTRNTTHYHVLKDRYTGRTGQHYGSFCFDDESGRLLALDDFQVQGDADFQPQ